MASTQNIPDEAYKEWSHEALVARVTALEKQLTEQQRCVNRFSPCLSLTDGQFPQQRPYSALSIA